MTARPSSRRGAAGVGGGQRLGEMEMWAIAAWNVPHLLAESVALKSDDLATRDALRQTLCSGSAEGAEGAEGVATHLTESWRALFFLLLGTGIRVELIPKSKGPGGNEFLNWRVAEPIKIDDVEAVELSLLGDDALEDRLETSKITEPFFAEDQRQIALECGHGGIEREVLEKKGHCKECGRQVEKTDEDNGVWKNQPCGHTGGGRAAVVRYARYCVKCKTVASRRTRKTVRVPVPGGLKDPRIWPVDAGGPHRELGVIDLETSVKHELTGKKVRYVPVVPPDLRTQGIDQGYRDLLLEVRRTRSPAGGA